MRKLKLFFAAIAVMMGMGANAQTWSASEVGEGSFVLYNVGTGQYFTRGNGWGTQASITTDGSPSSGMKLILESVNGNFKIRTDVNGTGFGVEHLNGGTIYTDQSRYKNSTWTFTQVATDNGPVYNIVSAENHGGGAGVYMTAGIDGTIVTPGTDGTIDGAKWKLLSTTTLALLSSLDRYKTIKTAAVGIVSNLDTTNPDAAVAAATTVEGIEEAIATLRAAFLTALPNVTIPTDPGYLDVTNVMLDNAGVHTNTDYWTSYKYPSSPNGGSFAVCNYGECEFYQQNFRFSQTVAMKKGTWEFGVSGFHRGGQGAYQTYFFAGDDQVLLASEVSSVVNSMAEAQTYFNNGNGKVSLKFIIEQDQNIEVGIDNQDTGTDKWTIFRDFTLKYYGPVDYSVYETQWSDAVIAANNAKAEHANVTGSELTALNAAIADAPDGSSKANYLEKIQALETATQTFIAAAVSYDKYVTYRAETVAAFGEALAATIAAPTSASEAEEAVHNLNVAQYNKVTSDYTYSCSGLIGDFGSWTGTATVAGQEATPNYLSNEHWSGQTHAYYEQAANGWGNSAGWTIKYEKKCTLPAGSYVLKVAARASEGTTGTVSCSATEQTIALPNFSAYGRGINKAGEASWTDGEFARDGVGFGWQWRFLPFTLAQEGEVTMTFYAEAKSQYQWMSIADGDLLSATKLAQDIVYDETKENTIEKTIIADVTIKRNIVEGYNTIVLPFQLTANQVLDAFGKDAVVYNFSDAGEKASETIVKFDRGDGSIKANTPVLVKVSKASTEQVFEGVQIVEGTPVIEGTYYSLTGIYSPKKLSGFDYIMNTDGIAIGSKAATINGFCAYLKVNSSSGRIIQTLIDGVDLEVVTGINGLFIENNNDGKLYNLNGQQVKNARKGLYIINGKKVVIK